MDDNREYETDSGTRGNKALPLFILLFLASLALNLFLFFKYAKNGAEIKEKNIELSELYKAANLRADSLQAELDFTLAQLQDKINENLAQEDLKEEIRQQLETKKAALSSAHRRISKLIASGSSSEGSYAGGTSGSGSGFPKNLAQAKNQISSLRQTNEEYLQKIEEVQDQYLSAQQDADKYQEEAKTYRIINDSLVEVTSTLNKKLEIASIMRVAGLKISPIREKNGKQEITEKASKTDRIKINFSVLESDLTEKEKKEMVIRIIAPGGVVLSKDNNKLQDIDEVTSLRETITYDGSEKGITFYYDQKAEYKKGSYKVELLSNGKILDRKSFSLR